MSVTPFKLEKFFQKYEFSVPYTLCSSDAESFSVSEVVEMASPEEKEMWDNLRLGYTQIEGLTALRKEIVKAFYPSLKEENILCFAGAEEAIFVTLHTLLDKGDHAIVLTPCYQSLVEIPKMKGAQIKTIDLLEKNNWKIDLNEIKSSLQPNTKFIIINFPHNPTGQVISKHELNELVSLCKQHGIWLFSDEVYRLLGKGPEDGWAPTVAEIYSNGISLGVMSKAFGMAGLRVGWIACQNREILEKIVHLKHYTTMCNSATSEILSLITLKNKEKILKRNNNIVEENIKLVDKFLEEKSDLFEWVRPQGGCTGFIKYKGNENIDDMVDRLVKEKGVLLLPGSVYDVTGNYFRIGFGRKNMPEALNKFKEFLELNK